MIAQFNRFEIEMTRAQAEQCSHAGDCMEDVQAIAPILSRSRRCTPDALRAELREYGAWDYDDLADDAANWLRIVWVAAGNITEELTERARGAGK